MLTNEHILAAQKANVETLFGLGAAAFEGVEKLIELNVTAARTALAEAAETAQSVLDAKDAQEVLALHAAALQPLAEKSVAYGRHLYEIGTTTSAEFARTVEGQFTDVQKKLLAAVDNAARNAPAGSETAVAVLKSAVDAGNNALESVQKAVKRAAEVAEANFNAVASSAASAGRTTGKTRRA